MYRILSPTAILGYGFPEASFARAMDLEIDLIAVDGGSVDAGPYYLGSGKNYMGIEALRRDLQFLVEGAIQQDCPLIIGSAGFSGSVAPMAEILMILEGILEHKGHKIKVASILSDIDPSQLVENLPQLTPLGRMPAVLENDIRRSRLVAQMGVEPIIAALNSGAQIIVCGRAYDPAVFAADPIRRGYPEGAAYHAAKILECGAIACDPGSGSDCLIAELFKEGRVLIYPTNPDRKATISSVAAHTLYEKSQPDLFHLPGGILSTRNTKYFQESSSTAGFEGTEFIIDKYTVKIEGAMQVGYRMVSLLPILPDKEVAAKIPVYGRNGVEASNLDDDEVEMGIMILLESSDYGVVKDALAFVRSTMLHLNYEGRLSTAGNLAFPFSPSDVVYQSSTGNYQGLVIAGTRDPILMQNWENIQEAVRTTLLNQHPQLHDKCALSFQTATREQPLAVVETIFENPTSLPVRHKKHCDLLSSQVDRSRKPFLDLDLGVAYVWSVHHLISDPIFIKRAFKIELRKHSEAGWKSIDPPKVIYPMGDLSKELVPSLHEPPMNRDSSPSKLVPLPSVAKVLRSKNSGINQITYDIMFNSKTILESAARSDIFTIRNLSDLLKIDPTDFVGLYIYPTVNAIKFTLHRKQLAGSPGDRDVFGAQQHSKLFKLMVPIH